MAVKKGKQLAVSSVDPLVLLKVKKWVEDWDS
jgi:hypothetical protein